MKMTLEKFNERVSRYIWDVVIPDAGDIPTKCLFGGIEKSGILRIDEKKSAALAALNIVDADGSVDVDQLKAVVNGAAEAGGGVIALGGLLPIKIPRTVIDKLYTYIETGTVQ